MVKIYTGILSFLNVVGTASKSNTLFIPKNPSLFSVFWMGSFIIHHRVYLFHLFFKTHFTYHILHKAFTNSATGERCFYLNFYTSLSVLEYLGLTFSFCTDSISCTVLWRWGILTCFKNIYETNVEQDNQKINRHIGICFLKTLSLVDC